MAVSMENLNFLERAWLSWYAYVGNDYLATGIFFFCMHETLYFGRSLVWMLIDRISQLHKYKIQEQKTTTREQEWKCMKHLLITHFTIEGPTMYFFHPFMQAFGLKTTVPFPSLSTMAWQCTLFFLFEDTFHYFGHRLLHQPYFYKRIHKMHHEFSAPFGLTASYASTYEIAFLGIGTVGAPILCLLLGGDLHMVTVYAWVCLRLLQAVDAHSGYDFPWSLHNWMPFWGGAAWHDKHHEKFSVNYSSSFKWWDIIFGTQSTKIKSYAVNEKRRAQEIPEIRVYST